MGTYRYEGTLAGKKISGQVEAAGQTEAAVKARESCDVLLSLREISGPAQRKAPRRLRRISAKDLALTCRQFAIILKGGLPLVQSVDLAAEQCGNSALAALLRQDSEDVSGGWSLSCSFEQRGAGLLPVTFREAVRAGEASGDLLSAFERMADYFEGLRRTHNSLAGALIYPAFVLATAAAVIAVIMGYAVPTLTSAFASLGTELPWATRALIAMSGFFRKYTPALAVLAVLILLGLRLWRSTEEGRIRLARLQLRLPVIGGVVRTAGASQFARTMSTLLASGMPILQAIEAAGQTVENPAMAREVLDALPGVEGGRGLGECLRFTRELPELLTRMTAAGEAAGDLESALRVLAEYYDNETEVRTRRALSLLEPVITVVLALFVAFILLAVYLPMFRMYAQI